MFRVKAIIISGNRLNQWHAASVSFNTVPGSSFTLRFEAVAGLGFQSDIAVDDVLLKIGSCPGK